MRATLCTLFLIPLVACGGEAVIDDSDTDVAGDTDTTEDTDTTGDTDTTDTDTMGTPVAGSISVQATDLVGLTGKAYLVFAGDGTPTGQTGSYCAMITDDPASVSGTIGTFVGDPCTPGDVVQFEPGTWTVTAGIYTPGSQTAELCAETTTTVDGDVVVEMPALGPC